MLDARSSAGPSHNHEAVREHVELVDVYDLPAVDLEPYAGVIVTGMVDQEFLHSHRDVVSAYLGRGRVVVFCGQLLRPWLPGCGAFVPVTVRSFRDYTVRLVTPHPVFAGVDANDLTFRRGVAGFFARGHHPLPPGAVVLAALGGGAPTTYVDQRTTPGTILAHAGTDLLDYAGDETTAGRVAPQLLAWVRSQGGSR